MNCSSVLCFFVHRPTLLINFICLIAFIVQFGSILQSYVNPEQTNIRVTERQITSFPLVFKICFSPGLNLRAIDDAGYDTKYGSWGYFLGKSKWKRSIVGWAGHTNTSGVRGSVEELVKKVQLHTAEEAITRIEAKSWNDATDWFQINLTSVKVWRMNYPDNCFTLDMTNNIEVQKKGMRMLSFQFPVKENSSVRVLPVGKELACNRGISSHRFYSTGDQAILSNQGEPLGIECKLHFRETN